MKADDIETRFIDYGVGVLRGVLARGELTPTFEADVEVAIEHIRGAARLIERLQRERR